MSFRMRPRTPKWEIERDDGEIIGTRRARPERTREVVARRRSSADAAIAALWDLAPRDLLRAMTSSAIDQKPRAARRASITLPRSPSRWRYLRSVAAKNGHVVSKRESKLLAYPGRRFR
jgi:hypothetical protein